MNHENFRLWKFVAIWYVLYVCISSLQKYIFSLNFYLVLYIRRCMYIIVITITLFPLWYIEIFIKGKLVIQLDWPNLYISVYTKIREPVNGRNKVQKLVVHFLKTGCFVGYPIEMYSKFDRPKWILVGQMV